MSALPHYVFITGGTGYMGRQLIRRLVERGHQARALVRPGSEQKLPPACTAVIGDAFRQKFVRQQDPAGRYLCAVGRSFSSQSRQGGGISQPDEQASQRRRREGLALGPCQRGPACAHARSLDPREWVEPDHSAPLVCAWTRASLAVRAPSGLLVAGMFSRQLAKGHAGWGWLLCRRCSPPWCSRWRTRATAFALWVFRKSAPPLRQRPSPPREKPRQKPLFTPR